MKFKRVISSIAAAATALSLNCFAASALITDKGVEYTSEVGDESKAESKPVLKVSKIVLNSADEAAGKIVTVTLSLEGENIDDNYCATGFHVQWDDRLTVMPTRTGRYFKTASGDNSAVSELGTEQQVYGKNGAFLCTMGKKNCGLTGDMYTIDFIVPVNAKAGDVYPIDVFYEGDTKSGRGDIFTNIENDQKGQNMEAYFFKKGINSKENPSTDPLLVNENAAYADGYITIAAGDETEKTEKTDKTENTYIQNKGVPYDAGSIDAEKAKSKPVLNVTKAKLSQNEAKGKIVTVEVNLTGENIDEKYSPTGFHVQWDERLKLINSSKGDLIKRGTGENGAVRELATEVQSVGSNGLFFATAASKDVGYSGLMFSFDLQIPEDIKTGDVFPIDVYYNAKVNKTATDVFTNIENDTDGQMMEAYFFTKGINSKENPSTDPVLVNAGASFADGYIYINDAAAPNKNTVHGDANCDGKVNIDDSVAVMEHYTSILSGNKSPLSEQGLKNADVDGDGTVDSSDASQINYYIENGRFPDEEKPLRGDANCDGKVDKADAAAIMDHYTAVLSGNKSQLSEQGLKNADIDGDKMVDASDASQVEHYIKYGRFPDEEKELRGDANCDGTVDKKDSEAILEHYSAVLTGSESPLSEQGRKNADVDGDGQIDASDASQVGYYITNGKFPDEDVKRGDVNGDGSVNLKDVVMLRRYIAGGWNVTVDSKIADINGDGSVNLKDVVMLRRYIAGGWNVTL